jgi:hypothetical protein
MRLILVFFVALAVITGLRTAWRAGRLSGFETSASSR